MYDLKNLLEDNLDEEYSPLFNKHHHRAAADLMSFINKLMKSGMSKEEVVALLDDVRETIEKNY